MGHRAVLAVHRDRRCRSEPISSQRLIEPVEQPRARLDRRDVELLVMGVCALAVDAEAVEGCGMRRGEIAVGAAAGERRRAARSRVSAASVLGVFVKRVRRRCSSRRADGSVRRSPSRVTPSVREVDAEDLRHQLVGVGHASARACRPRHRPLRRSRSAWCRRGPRRH